MKFLDLFAGIGGFRLGLESTGSPKRDVGAFGTSVERGKAMNDEGKENTGNCITAIIFGDNK